jgi:hypothetical protein
MKDREDCILKNFIRFFFSECKQNDQVKEDEMGRAQSMLWEMMNAYRILVGKPEGKRPVGRP